MRYAKAGVAALAVIASYLVARFTGGALDPNEWANVVLAGLTAGGVFTGPNVPGAPVTKSAIAALGAVFTVLNTALVGADSAPAWWQFVVAALSAAAVYFVPNRPPAPPVAPAPPAA